MKKAILALVVLVMAWSGKSMAEGDDGTSPPTADRAQLKAALLLLITAGVMNVSNDNNSCNILESDILAELRADGVLLKSLPINSSVCVEGGKD